ncbi:MAG: hypothetical protein IAE83_01575 [Anaerolinea sp.]|nr:hypothetical protein [Anaerolinea sp.]
MAASKDAYTAATQKTSVDLKTIAATPKIAELSRLTLPEIEALSDQIAQVVPAGSVPGLVLNGLISIQGRQVPAAEQERHLAMLFRGIRDLLDKAIYGAILAGPAAVIMGYQKLLQLAGKDIESAFPEGTWQYYLNFALREDTARHANETTGFQHALSAHHISLSEADTLAAWIMAALMTLQNYALLLGNEWRERVYTQSLVQAAEITSLSAAILSKLRGMYSAWERERPYMRGQDAGKDDYVTYRRRKFDAFCQQHLDPLPTRTQKTFARMTAQAEHDLLPAYVEQMTILARLEPGQYRDKKVLYPLAQAGIVIIHRGQYTRIPVFDPNRQAFLDFAAVREVTTRLLADAPKKTGSDPDLLLARASRAAQAGVPKVGLRALSEDIFQFATALHNSPIMLNWDRADARLPLTLIRQGQRGIGDHALTLFFTDESTVFDQSHIFFDGAWGAALAEIMTNEALSWALYFSRLPAVKPHAAPLSSVRMSASPKLREASKKAQVSAEASAESTMIRLAPVLALRRLFKTRNDLITVTVNDLLILYRSLHGQRYSPFAPLQRQLGTLEKSPKPENREVHQLIMQALEKVKRSNPAILIPMDASQHSPKERLFLTTFRNPMPEFLQWHDSTLAALRAYKEERGDRSTLYAAFDRQQRHLLRMLAGFGELMRKYKEIALLGQSTSTIAIKMLAHLPEAVQRLLNQLPDQFDVLNEIIKGEEVFSNIGRVVNGSTLRRFITAKDDNQQKSLAWAVITDDQDVVHVSLRDFRPHVEALQAAAMGSLADLIAQDFLDSYTDGFNLFIRELREITAASRETRFQDKPS